MKDDSNLIRRPETRSMDYLYEHLEKTLSKSASPLGIGEVSSVSNVVSANGAVSGMPVMMTGSIIPMNLLEEKK